ncbi:unnamed protein product [Urochloa decumbens]|uniref:Uncharacterized protein n=1 Tax=Urochloa decumbens TaxID=240449 RepID=A0ABC9EEL7_9POAL
MMAMSTSKPFVLPLLMVVLMLLVLSGSARRLEGDRSTGGEAAVGVGGLPIIQFLKGFYLQQLSGPNHSCGTYDPHNPNCHGH